MNRILLISVGIVIALCIFYVWYAHASIYWKLGAHGIGIPYDMKTYIIGPGTAPPLTYTAIGDSLTAGVGVDTYTQSYPYIIAEMLATSTRKKVLLDPFAIPGIRTSYVLSEFINPIIESKPDVVTLFIGTNDIHGNVSLATFRKNYETLVVRLTQETSAHIYLINLPYIGTKNLIDPLFHWYFDLRTRQYNEVIKALALAHNVTYIDLYDAHAPHALDDTYYAADSFHPNALGYTSWAQNIYAGFTH